MAFNVAMTETAPAGSAAAGLSLRSLAALAMNSGEGGQICFDDRICSSGQYCNYPICVPNECNETYECEAHFYFITSRKYSQQFVFFILIILSTKYSSFSAKNNAVFWLCLSIGGRSYTYKGDEL
jgi:hypothetical protein